MAIELFLSNHGDSLVPVNDEGYVALSKYPKDTVLRVKLTQARSLPHHRFFFAFMREAFDNWPDDHRVQPPNEDWLRQWLMVRAGIKETAALAFESGTSPDPMGLVRMLKAITGTVTKRPIWFSIDTSEGTIEAMWAKSVAFDKMDEAEFKETTSKVFKTIFDEVGIDCDVYYLDWQKKYGKLKVEPSRVCGLNV